MASLSGFRAELAALLAAGRSVAALVGVSKRTLQRWLQGSMAPSPVSRAAVARLAADLGGPVSAAVPARAAGRAKPAGEKKPPVSARLRVQLVDGRVVEVLPVAAGQLVGSGAGVPVDWSDADKVRVLAAVEASQARQVEQLAADGLLVGAGPCAPQEPRPRFPLEARWR